MLRRERQRFGDRGCIDTDPVEMRSRGGVVKLDGPAEAAERVRIGALERGLRGRPALCVEAAPVQGVVRSIISSFAPNGFVM